MLQLDTQSKRRLFETQAMKRVQHHAPLVKEIAPYVIRAVFDHADPGTIFGHQYRGKLTGSGWANFGGRRVWGGYNRRLKQIELREGGRTGKALARFDNNSSKSEVERQISKLARGRRT
jgi:hypothetical protein